MNGSKGFIPLEYLRPAPSQDQKEDSIFVFDFLSLGILNGQQTTNNKQYLSIYLSFFRPFACPVKSWNTSPGGFLPAVRLAGRDKRTLREVIRPRFCGLAPLFLT